MNTSTDRRWPGDLNSFLERHQEEIVERSMQELSNSRSLHYKDMASERLASRLRRLLRIIGESVFEAGAPLMECFAREIAIWRHKDGFALTELQGAFNSIEASIWGVAHRELDPRDFVDLVSRVTFVVGSGKDAIAKTYLDLASGGALAEADIAALAGGAAAGEVSADDGLEAPA